MDMENSAVQMARCGNTQCFPGMQQVMPFQTMQENLEARANTWLEGECDVVGCEGTRVANQQVVFEHAKPSMVRDLLLLRDPVDHVVSMFEMCAVNHPESDNTTMNSDTSTFERWLAAWEANDRITAFSLCYYSPGNLQTTALVAAEGVTASARELAAAETLVSSDAYFVGLVESYSLSLCLLGAMVHGASSLPTGCTCDAAEKQVELGHTVEPNVRDESSDDHGTASVNVELTENALASIHRLTSLDRALYQVALSRFEADVRRSGLGCWIDLAK